MDNNAKEFVIEGTAFMVDAANMALVEKADPANILSYRDMTYMDSYYTFRYDKSRHSIASPGAADADVVRVKMPQFKELDPEGMAARFQLPVDVIEERSDLSLVVNDDYFRQRDAGILPTLKIGEDVFTIDVRLQEIRHNSGMMDPIRFIDMEIWPAVEQFSFLYDTKAKSIYKEDPAALSLPENVVQVVIPDEFRLDPYGSARAAGTDPKRFMFHYPPATNIEAVIIPIDKTWLADRVNENRDKWNRGEEGKDEKQVNQKKL